VPKSFHAERFIPKKTIIETKRKLETVEKERKKEKTPRLY
jgi:hypothetical protein